MRPTARLPKRPTRAQVVGLLIFVGLAYLSSLAIRNMALFALGATPFIGACLAALGHYWAALGKRSETRDRVRAAAVGILFAVVVWAGAGSWPAMVSIAGMRRRTSLVRECSSSGSP